MNIVNLGPRTEASAVDGMLASSRVLVEYLSAALALERAPSVVRLVRERAHAPEDGRLAIAFGEQGPFVIVIDDAVAVSTVDDPHVGARVDLHRLLREDDVVCEALLEASASTRALPDAAAWLRAIASDAPSLNRETFEALAGWSPLVSVELFRQLTCASMALEVERRPLIDLTLGAAPEPRALSAYWATIHMIGNASLLATTGDDRAWLAGLEANVPQGTWTPSFTLVRERCFRLAVQGAWAAAAFGEQIVPRYLRAIDARGALLRTFDAALGLTAVALRDETNRDAIGRELRLALDRSAAASRQAGERDLVLAMRRSVDIALAPEPPPVGGASLAFTIDDDDDCARFENGIFPCIVALAAAIPATAGNLYYDAGDVRRVHGRSDANRARDVLLRTGLPTAERAARWTN